MSTTNGVSPKVTTLEQLRTLREIEPVLAPSGNYYRVRPLHIQRHALSGGLPAKLRDLGLQGAQGLNRLFSADDGTMSEVGLDARDYLDRLVTQVIVKPDLTLSKPRRVELEREGEETITRELKAGDPDPEKIELLPPVDYKWALEIAFMEQDRDGEGRLLWGRESLDRWAIFRDEHGCEEDCASCDRVRGAFSLALR